MPSAAHVRCGSASTPQAAPPRPALPAQRALAAALGITALATAVVTAPEAAAMAVKADVAWTLDGITDGNVGLGSFAPGGIPSCWNTTSTPTASPISPAPAAPTPATAATPATRATSPSSAPPAPAAARASPKAATPSTSAAASAATSPRPAPPLSSYWASPGSALTADAGDTDPAARKTSPDDPASG